MILTSNKYKKIISSVSKENFGLIDEISISLFNGDNSSCNEPSSAHNGPSTSTRSHSLPDKSEVMLSINERSYETIVSLEYDISDFVSDRKTEDKTFDSKVFTLDGFGDNLFQMRLSSMSLTSRQYGMCLRTNKPMEQDINLKFAIKLTQDNRNICEQVMLMAGCVEAKTIRIHSQAYSLFSRYSSSKSHKIMAKASCQLTFPMSYMDQFCAKYLSLEQEAHEILTRNPEEVEIRCGENKITALKRVLSSASHYFSTIIMSKFLEHDSNIITFKPEDIDFVVLKAIVDFIYNDTLDKERLAAEDVALYKAAIYFGLPKLETMARESIWNGLTPAKAMATMVSAHQHDDKNLKDTAMDYVIQNLSKCQKLTTWRDLFKDHPELIDEILYGLRYKSSKYINSGGKSDVGENKSVTESPKPDAIVRRQPIRNKTRARIERELRSNRLVLDPRRQRSRLSN